MDMMPTTFLAWWGAGLSTLLAATKLWEFWRDRFRIEVSHNFTTHPDIGNEVLVRNLNDYPIILSYWELLWLSGRWPFLTQTPLESPDEYTNDTRIDAHSTLTLTFSGRNDFDWGVKAMKGRRIYLRLHFPGRLPKLHKVYG